MILLLLILVVALYFQFRPKRVSEKLPEKIRKRVTFNPIIQVASAGGRKSDRHNPDLRDCVSRNSSLARSVGGAKRLVEIDLQAGQ